MSHLYRLTTGYRLFAFLVSVVALTATKEVNAQCNGCSYRGTSVITNGNFSSGNTGFSSSYKYNSDLYPEGNYYIGTDPKTYHGSFVGKDHTTGTGKFMIINGSPNPGTKVWCQTIAVTPNTNYDFSTWVCSVHPTSPALLQFTVNGVVLGSVFQAPNTTNTWKEFYFTWNSGSTTSATICIENMSTIAAGNDFGLDDISFSPCLPYNVSAKATAGPDVKACYSVNQTIGANSTATNISYNWSPSTYLSSSTVAKPTVTYTNTGTTPVTLTYILTVDSAGLACTTKDTVLVTVYPDLGANLGVDKRVCNTSVNLLNSVTADSLKWSTGATTSSINVNQTGNYIVTLYRWGCTDKDTIGVIIDTVPTFSLPADIYFCAGKDTVIKSPKNGLWNTGVTATQITVNSPGTYYQTVTNGTCTYTDTINVYKLNYPVVNLGPDLMSCTGGSFTLNAGQSGTWQNGSVGNTFTATTSGTYIVKVYNQQCMSSDTVKVGIKNVLPVDLPAPQTVCAGTSVTLSFAYNGSPSILWSTGATTPTINVNTTGTYWVKITDSTCTSADTTTLTVNTMPVLNLPPSIKICEGQDTTLSIPNNPAYTYSWNTGAGGNSLNVSTAGNYIVTVTNGPCIAKDTTQLIVVTVPVVTLPSLTTICKTGSLTLNGSTTPGYTNLWSTGSTASSISVSNAGTYTLKVTNDICSASASSVLKTDTLPLSLLPDSLVFCENSSGVLNANASGGVGVSWSNGQSGNQINVSVPGTYKVTLTNGQCTLVDSAIVKVDILPVSILPDSVIFCETGSGNLQANATAGVGVTWSNGATSNNISVTTPGWFKVTLKKGTCTVVDSAYSKVDLMPVVSLPPALKICQGIDTAISVALNPAYSYLWNTGSTSNSINTNIAGTYSVKVTNGTCNKTVSTVLNTVTVPDAVLPALSVICKTSSLTLNGSTIPGYLNKWSTGATTSTITVTAAGSYLLTVTNDICSDTAVAMLKVDTVPVSILPDTVVFCENSPAQLKANTTSGIGVTWSNGATTNAITVSSPGTYKVTLQNGSCSVSDSAVAKMDLLPVSILPDSLIFCENVTGTLQANSTTGVGVSWNTGATTNSINVTTAGKYTATLVRGLCTVKDSAIVKVDVMPVISLPPSIKVCQGVDTGLTVNLNPAYTYLWSNGVTGNHININTAGTYSVTVKNGSCTQTGSTALTTVTVPDADLPSLSTICKTGSVTLNGSTTPGYTNKWSNGSTASSITVSTAGTYSLIVTNDICKDTSIAVVKVDTVPLSTLPDTMVICENGSGVLHANASNGAGILWSTGATTDAITVTTPGVYKLKLINGECSLNDSTIVKADLLPVSILPDSLVFCENVSGTLKANSTAGVNVSWSTGTSGNQITVTAPGKYTATLVRGMCTIKDSAIVKVDALPVISLPPTIKVCAGVDTGLTVNLNPAYTYSWSNGATGNHININAPGTYSVTVKNGTCTNTGSTSLTNVTVPTAVLPPLTAICVPASATLTGSTTPGYINKWSTGVTAPSITVTKPGTYSLIVINDICSDTAFAEIKVDSMPVTSLPDSLIFCENVGNSILNAHGEVGASVLWSTGATTDAITVNSAGKYKVTLTRGACIATDSTIVKVDLLPVSILPDSLVFCENANGTLQANATPGVGVSWSTGASGNSITIGAAGMYKATLVRGTCTVKDSAIVKVDKLPLLNLPPALKICAGQDTSLVVVETPGYNYTWNTGSTSNTINITAAGTYAVTVKNGSCTSKDSTKLTTVPVPNITLPALTTICENSSLVLNGSTTNGYVNSWSTGSSATSITVNQPGTYSLTVTNDICSDTALAVVKTDKLPLSVLPDSLKICENSSGTLTANATPGVGVQWSNGGLGDAITVSTPGTYVVTLTNGVCILKDTAKVKQVKLPVSILPDSLVFCDNISSTLKANNTPGISVLWNTGATTDAITVSDAGKYLVTLTNDICSVDDSAIVKTDPYPVVLLPSDLNICEGTDTTLVLALGSGQTYTWNTGATSNTITVSTAGTYIGTVKNGTCTASDTTKLVIITKPVFELPAFTTICENDSLQLKSGLASSYVHQWSTGAKTTSIYAKNPGKYTLTVGNGMCATTHESELKTDVLPVSALPPSVTFCENATAVVNAGNNPGATVQWSNGETSPGITIDEAGTYSVTITNGKCVTKASLVAKTDKLPLATLPEPFKLCSNRDTILKLDGVANYQVRWSTGETTPSIKVRDAGDYSVSVTNKSCIAKDTTTLIQVEAPVFSLPTTEQICETHILTLESNAKPEFKHRWTTGSEERMIKVNSPGIYGLCVTNDICAETRTTELKVDNMPISTVPTNYNYCENVDGTLIATNTSGASVLWNTGATTNSIKINQAGSYSVTVTKGKCKSDATSVVTVDKLPVVDLPAKLKICEGTDTALAVVLDPNYSYNWSNGYTSNTIKISQPGKYTVKVTNGNCLTQDSTQLAVVTVPVVNLPDQNSICSTDSLKLAVSTTSGYTNQWSTGATSASIFVKDPGSYFLTVTNDICSTTDTSIVKVDAAPLVTLPANLKICEGTDTTLTLTEAPGYAYNWSTGATTNSITISTPGKYTVTVTNGNCIAKDTAQLAVVKVPLSNLPDQTSICSTDSLKLSGSTTSGYTNTWSTGASSSSIFVKDPGSYFLTITNDICSTTDTSIVKVDAAPIVALPATMKICEGTDTTLTVTVAAGYAYNWSTGATTNEITISSPGKYMVTVTNGSCVVKDTAQLAVVKVPLTNLPNQTSICSTDSLKLTGSTTSGYTNKWSTGASSASIFAKDPGIYTLTVTNDICSTLDTAEVKVDELPQSVLTNSIQFCENTTGQLTASNNAPGTILWNTGETTPSISVNKAGTYSVTLVNGSCTVNDSATVKVDEMPVVELKQDLKICEGQSTNISVALKNGFACLWSTGATANKIVATKAGTYSVEVTNGTCKESDSTELKVLEVPVAQLPPSTRICSTDSVTLSGSSTFANSWSTGATTTAITVDQPGTYQLIVTNDICSDTASTLVKVDQLPVSVLPDSVVFCENANGTLRANATSGIQVTWNTGSTKDSITVTAAGEYTVQLKNGACTVLDTAIAKVDVLPVFNLPDSILFCNGLDTSVAVTPNPGWTYAWTTGATSNSVAVTESGKIGVAVSNGACVTKDSVNVKKLDYPQLSLSPEVSICVTDSTILDPKSDPTFGYKWSDGSTSPTLKVKTDGNYSVEVWNRQCLSTASVVLKTDAVPQSLLTDSASWCETNQGTLTATTSPNTAILWNTGEATASITPTQAGKYTVTITNGKCVTRDTTSVKIDAMPVINLLPSHKICQGDSIQIKSNGTNGYQYSWSNGKTSPSFFAKQAGDYILTVKNGLCQLEDTTTLTVLEVPVVVLPDSIKICETDSALIMAKSNVAYAHSWNNGASGQYQNVNTAGNYVLTVSNEICKAKDSTLVIVNRMPNGILPDSIRYCEGGPIQLQATNSTFTSVNWSTGQNGNLIQTGKSGLITTTITNGLCVKLDSIFVTIDPKPVVQLPDSVTFCQGGDTILSYIAKDNETIRWSTGATGPELKVNSPSTVTITVQNLSCKTIDTTVVIVLPFPVSQLDADMRICVTDSVYLQPGGLAGCQYEWNTGAKTSTIWAKANGLYTVVLKNGPCAVKDSVFVTTDSLPVFTVPQPQRFCKGDTVHVSLLGHPNYLYKWNATASSEIEVTTPGVFTYSVTNGKCSVKGSMAVKMDLLPVPNVKDQIICAGDTAAVVPVKEDSVNYTWNDGTTDLNRKLTENGDYILLATRGTCSMKDTMHLEVKPLPELRMGEDFTLCDGDTFRLSAGNDSTYSYVWRNENGNVVGKTAILSLAHNNAPIGSHTFTVTATLNGCKASGEMKGNVYGKPNVDLGPDISICADSAKLNATGTYTSAIWNDGRTESSRFARYSGTFYMDVRNEHCKASDTVIVQLSRVPNVDLPADTTICKGNFIIYTIGEKGTWSDGSFGNTFIANESGKYSVTVVKGSCTTTEESNLTVLAPPKMDLPDTTICSNAPLKITDFPKGCEYSWTRGEVEDNVVTIPGDYQITMTNMCGSYATNFTVLVEECGRTLYFPTAFTPDQDGTNDNFNVIATGYEDIVLMIFDRFGELIYQEKSKKPSWDGSYKGQKVKTDTYEVRVIGEYRLVKGGALLTQEEFGKVTILK